MPRPPEVQEAIFQHNYSTLSIKGSRGGRKGIKKTHAILAQRRARKEILAFLRAEKNVADERKRQVSANEHILTPDGEPVGED